jgi:hypothetical protein
VKVVRSNFTVDNNKLCQPALVHSRVSYSFILREGISAMILKALSLSSVARLNPKPTNLSHTNALDFHS